MAIDLETGSSEEEAVPKKRLMPFQLFRYASLLDRLLMLLGLLLALAQGAGIPLALYFFYAEIINSMIIYSPCFNDIRQVLIDMSRKNISAPTLLAMIKQRNEMAANNSAPAMNIFQNIPQKVMELLNSTRFEKVMEYKSLANINADSSLFEDVWPLCVYYALVGLGMFLAGSIHVSFWSIAGQRQVDRIRKRLFEAMLAKDAAWFDSKRVGALNAILFDDVRKIEEGITRISNTASWIGVAITGFVIAFVTNWLVTIVIFSLVPLIFASGFTMVRLVRSYSVKQSSAYASAGSIANEVLTNIRTVLAFNRQEYEVGRYAAHLGDSLRMGTIKTVVSGTAQGIALLVISSMAGLAFWWGNSDQVGEAGGSVMQIILCIMMATTSLANAAPNFASIAAALAGAESVFGIIEHVPKIDNFSLRGKQPKSLRGEITFEKVSFAYPGRPDRQIFQALDLKLMPGQTVALVGGSGSGKSTAAQLLLRFYDTTSGRVLLDDNDVKTLHIKWLRQQMAVVSQEPVLFNMSIGENIRLGAMKKKGQVGLEEMEKAAKLANAHEFISKLPDGYDTMVGERGAQLSGGQKQRIAIARALISDPKILILDEATSALDTTSERVVQDALDKARVGRTSMVIAHRLTTIRHADLIAVIDGGKVAELGTHDELIQIDDGIYQRLVRRQQVEAVTGTAVSETSNQEAPSNETNVNEEKEIVQKTELPRNSNISPGPAELSNFQIFRTVLNWGRPELAYTIACAIVSAISAALQPAIAIVISEFMASFCPGDNEDTFTMLIGIMVGLGGLQAVTMAIQHYFFAVIGERLTRRIRNRLLGKLLRMDAAWLDRQENQPSILTTTLATDCLDIQGLSGVRISAHVTMAVIIGIAVIYSLVLDYRIALALLGLMPMIVISNIFYGRMVMGSNGGGNAKTGTTVTVAMDALANMRTVMSLTGERFFLQKFAERNSMAKAKAIKMGILAGPVFSLAMSAILWAGAITFSLGAWLMENDDVQFRSVIRIYVLITFSGMFISRSTTAIPTEEKARKAAKKLLAIFNQSTTIDPEDPHSHESLAAADMVSNPRKRSMGRIEFKNVSFSYPTRPGVKIFNNVSFTVEPGQRVAFCGPSGGGKSTIMQLIQRLYDPDGGQILLDGQDLAVSNVRALRSQIGLVAQEPNLFAKSLEDNVAYGFVDTNDCTQCDACQKRIAQACGQANVLEFVKKLPEGMKTQVGERGAQLSGGQKQRIAIARALVRNPAVLLLDEATSALDTESEKIVQVALEQASEGRTTLTIAHRLSTIQNSDKILVLAGGRVAESGKHDELLAQRGIYYELHNSQQK